MRLLFEIDKKDYDPDGEAFIRPSARAIIFRGDKIAVIRSQKYGFYKIPGGGIERMEDAVNAMVREVREEAGLIVIPESVREYGYVHRVQKGEHEAIFIQDNYYYFCEVADQQLKTDYTETEKNYEFEFMWEDLDKVIRANEAYVKSHPDNTMIEREALVLAMVKEEMRKQ